MEQELTETPTDSSRETYLRNYETLHAILNGGRHVASGSAGVQAQDVTVRLSRVVMDEMRNTTVTFDGEAGLEALLAKLHAIWPHFVPSTDDGRLVGLTGSLFWIGSHGAPVSVDSTFESDNVVPLSVSLGAGGQLTASVGPTNSIDKVLRALEGFDRQIHVAALELGHCYQLVSEGYNPLVTSPLDVPLVPRTRFTLQNAHLGQTGRYARDMMRCCCSCEVVLAYDNEREAVETFQLATALSPLMMFLTDNVRSFRGSGARRCPRMARSIIYDEVDPSRCGVVPGTFGRQMSFDNYIEWLMGIQPILFVDAMGTTTSCGKKQIRDVLTERVLSSGEAIGLIDSATPYVRLGTDIELLQADALKPRMAAAYAAFVKGLLTNPLARDNIWSMLTITSDHDIEAASHELRARGWNARIYGCEVATLTGRLVELARQALSPSEQRILDNIAELWEVHMVPRDAFVAQEIRARRGW